LKDDLGVEPFLINSSMLACSRSALVRRICVKCREELPVAEHYRHDGGTRSSCRDRSIAAPASASTVAAPATRASMGVVRAVLVSRRRRSAHRAARTSCGRERAQARRARGAGCYARLLEAGLHKAQEGQTSIDEVCACHPGNPISNPEHAGE
jgi:type II secretory ATPase GspE/PulE/Tfp pilus assembly ATPase PilB-like protein